MKKGIDFIGVGCGAMIFNEEGKVFISKRGPKSRNEVGRWDFPGGSVDFGERCIDAIKREIKEEFDFEIEIVEMFELVDHIIKEEGQHWVSPSYIAKYKSGIPKIMEPEKCPGFKWVDVKELDPDLLSKPSRSNLLKYLERIRD